MKQTKSVVQQDLPSGYQLRPAELADLPNIVELLLACFFPRNFWNQWIYGLLRLGIYEDLKRRLQLSARQYRCLIIVRSGLAEHPRANRQVVGTAELSLRSYYWPMWGSGEPYVSNIAIAPDHRRQGLAQQLLRACEDEAQAWGFSRIALHVAAENAAAQALYFKTGYGHYRRTLPRRRRQLLYKALQA